MVKQSCTSPSSFPQPQKWSLLHPVCSQFLLNAPYNPSFLMATFPPGSAAASKSNPQASQKKVSSRQRKGYRRSVLHRASLAVPSLPPPKNGSLRQAALACVQRLQADSAFPVSIQIAKKRPLPDSPSAPSPSSLSPLAQRIRKDIQVGESETESPEKEILRSPTLPENSPSPISPCMKGLPSPAPLIFTPVPSKESSCLNCEAVMTPDHQCEATDSDSNWEDVENELDLYPTLEVDSEDWAEKFTNNIRRFMGYTLEPQIFSEPSSSLSISSFEIPEKPCVYELKNVFKSMGCRPLKGYPQY